MNDISFNTGVIKPVECVKEGWELIKNDYWVLFAVALVGGLIGGFTMYILLGAMICGIFYCYLQAIDGKPVSFDGLWKGFDVGFIDGIVNGVGSSVKFIGGSVRYFQNGNIGFYLMSMVMGVVLIVLLTFIF